MGFKPDGAKEELNERVQAQSRVYYFSIAANNSYRVPLLGWHVPKTFMNPFLLPSSFLSAPLPIMPRGMSPSIGHGGRMMVWSTRFR